MGHKVLKGITRLLQRPYKTNRSLIRFDYNKLTTRDIQQDGTVRIGRGLSATNFEEGFTIALVIVVAPMGFAWKLS